jgi:predicted GNAT family acetyltransferase
VLPVTVQTAPSVRPLTVHDVPAVRELLDADPVGNVFVRARLDQMGLETLARMGELYGFGDAGALTSLCYFGANMVPVAATPRALHAYAAQATRQPRRSSSIVGPAQHALALGEMLRATWGEPREIRARQPVLAIDRESPVTPDPGVRLVRPDEVDQLMPAAVAMFTEEVGVDPRVDGGAALYRARVTELVHTGRAYARFHDGDVVFKAEVGAVSAHACQIQGVWVRPDMRGRGLSVPGMAAVVRHALRDHADVVSLYVNDYNVRARAAYRSVGFAEVDVFATVLY